MTVKQIKKRLAAGLMALTLMAAVKRYFPPEP